MQLYKAVRFYHAAEIVTIVGNEIFLKGEAKSVVETEEFFKRHDPQAGQFMVFYKDGYRSICPKDQFLRDTVPVDSE